VTIPRYRCRPGATQSASPRAPSATFGSLTPARCHGSASPAAEESLRAVERIAPDIMVEPLVMSGATSSRRTPGLAVGSGPTAPRPSRGLDRQRRASNGPPRSPTHRCARPAGCSVGDDQRQVDAREDAGRAVPALEPAQPIADDRGVRGLSVGPWAVALTLRRRSRRRAARASRVGRPPPLARTAVRCPLGFGQPEATDEVLRPPRHHPSVGQRPGSWSTGTTIRRPEWCVNARQRPTGKVSRLPAGEGSDAPTSTSSAKLPGRCGARRSAP
jgi:hypothetical protein